MEITTYKKIYHQPVNNIPVPKAMQHTGFEVYFMPLSVPQGSNQVTAPISSAAAKKIGAGSIMRAYFADVPPPNSPEEDFVLPERHSYTPLDIK